LIEKDISIPAISTSPLIFFFLNTAINSIKKPFSIDVIRYPGLVRRDYAAHLNRKLCRAD
jgi:hypothetical protein